MASTRPSIELCTSRNNTSQFPTKPKRRNSEKRKEKSRNAARCRRGKETEIYCELAGQLPLSQNVCEQLDKAGIMRLCISYLKTRQLIPHSIQEMCIGNKENDSNMVLDSLVDDLYLKSIEGFLYVLSQEGDIVYLSENVSRYLGLTQVDLMGQSIYEYTHPCDHEEIREQLAHKLGSSTDTSRVHQNFLLRLKCTLTDKGKTVNLKSSIYKVVQCIGHKEWVDSMDLKNSPSRTLCLVVIASPIPHPSNIEHPLDSKTFVSRHNLDMTFTDCDKRIEELLGYNVSEVESHSFYKFFHVADNEVVEKNLKDLYAKGQAVIGQYRFLAKDGGYAWISTEATIIYHNKTGKPQCIVCIHYMISGIEHEKEIVSLDQEVANTKAKGKSRKEGSDSPFVYWSTSENQTVEVDPSELDYLAPTPGEVFVPLFSSTMKDGDLSAGNESSIDYSEMMHGIGDNFMDFNPFAPMDFKIEENQMLPQEMETDQKNDVTKDQILPTDKYTSSSEDEILDELGMNAPVILDEGCQFTSNLLTDLDGICLNSCKSVNPFSSDAMICSAEQETLSDSGDGMIKSPNGDTFSASLYQMTGLSRSMPNMHLGSAVMNINGLTGFHDRMYKSVTPSHLDMTTNQFFAPEDYLCIKQNMCDQRNIPPDILHGLPVYKPQSQLLPLTSQMLLQPPQFSPLQISTSQMSPLTSQNSPGQMTSSQIEPLTSHISPLQMAVSQISPHTSQISPHMSLISQQASQIIPTSSTSSSGMMPSFPNILINCDPEKLPGPDWMPLEVSQPSMKLPFDLESKRTDISVLKRKLSTDINPIKAKLFVQSTGNNRMLAKKELYLKTVNCPIDKYSTSTVDRSAWDDMLNQSEYNTVNNTLTHSKLLQQVAMKANESLKSARTPAQSLLSTAMIANLTSSSSLLDSMPLITQYDAEVNAPITSSCLLQGNELLRALEQALNDS